MESPSIPLVLVRGEEWGILLAEGEAGVGAAVGAVHRCAVAAAADALGAAIKKLRRLHYETLSCTDHFLYCNGCPVRRADRLWHREFGHHRIQRASRVSTRRAVRRSQF